MPGEYCCVIGCNNAQRDKKVAFHRFPADPATRSKWIKFVRREISKNSLICSEHFKKDDYDVWENFKKGHISQAVYQLDKSAPRLKKGAVPSVEISSNFRLSKR